MSAEANNALIAVFTFVTVIISIANFVLTRADNAKQARETKDLAQLTSELQGRVHRLATNLDQSIYKLNRVRDLTNGLLRDSVGLRQLSRSQEDKLNYAVERGMALPELHALAKTIKDDELLQHVFGLMRILLQRPWPELWNVPYDLDANGSLVVRSISKNIIDEIDDLILEQSDLTRQIHERVLVLLDQKTQPEFR